MIARGSYIQPGKKPEPNDKRLHLLIEGNSEMSVRQAKLELQRALDEETSKVSGNISSGRYSVV